MRRTPLFLNIFFVAFVLLGTTEASARSHRVTQIPHGSRFDCTSCHVLPSGGDALTGFGSDARGSQMGDGGVGEQDTNWGPLAGLDSDRDGWTNGEELNDVSGTWVIGDPNPVGSVTNPGDANSHPPSSCGDGRVTPPETCDGTNTGNFTCMLIGKGEGTLSCRDDCTYDTTKCDGADDFNNGTGEADVGSPDASDSVTQPDEGCASTTGNADWFALLFFGVVLGTSRRRRCVKLSSAQTRQTEGVQL